MCGVCGGVSSVEVGRTVVCGGCGELRKCVVRGVEDE